MNPNPKSTLAAPGAGLPVVELQIARLLTAFRRATGKKVDFTSQFNRERDTIRQLLASCPESAGGTRVLIDRVIGLEDSSRYWSVWMALDHLRIVHVSMTRIIGDLAKDRIPEGTASTATVKPSAEVTASVISEYEASCDAVLAVAESVPNLKTKLRYAHPWFGPMDAHGWYALAAGHLAIHRGQIERILQGLANPRA